MKNINLTLSTLLFLSILTISPTFAITCNGTGKANGQECHFIDCECASDVCFNGLCVQCVADSDCPDSQSCVENACQ